MKKAVVVIFLSFGIPSAEEMAVNGIELKAMNLALL